jgi:ketosteroid isomerase-like protein
MGEARKVLDQLTEAIFNQDYAAVEELYAPDAVAVTPDQGELKGAGEVIGYTKQFIEAFPDVRFEPEFKHESGDTAIDEGWFVGTNSGPLALPTGETLPPTGKRVRVRGADIATVENGRVTSHRFYYDQLEFLGQLGLAPETPG